MFINAILVFLLSQGNYCALCHSDIQARYSTGIHAKEEVQCVDCHGGDAKADDMNKAHSGDFKGALGKKAALELCASCHSDLEKMKPYNLPVDQYALYISSYHGKAFSKGENNAATCIDCHGSHEIAKRNNPASLVSNKNILATCEKCHANKELMGKYGLSATAVEDYRASIHAEELFDKGNEHAPSCMECHGSHGFAPPGVSDVAKVCGRCHSPARESFVTSKHKKAMDEQGIPECAGCHHNHKVEKAGPELFYTVCNNCHPKESEEYQTALKIVTLFSTTKQQIETAQSAIEAAEMIQLNVEDYKSRIEEALTYYTRAEPLIHAMKIEAFEDYLSRARAISEEIQSEIHKKKAELNDRKIILVAVWFYILITVIVIYYYGKTKEKKEVKSDI